MYILERDQGVLVWDVEVHGYFEGEPDSDADGFNDSVDAPTTQPQVLIPMATGDQMTGTHRQRSSKLPNQL